MKPISIFYHCLFLKDNVPIPGMDIITEQMTVLEASGLLDKCYRFFVGVNGGASSSHYLDMLPQKAFVELHGIDQISETPTMVRMWEHCKHRPGQYVLYFHAKGATHTDPEYLRFVGRWRKCMQTHLILNWRTCIEDLDTGLDSVGCHWMTNMSPPSDKDAIWGGNFFWATSDFIATLPDIMDRELIKTHGKAAPIARYEGERWIGSGPRHPKIKDYHVNGIGSCP